MSTKKTNKTETAATAAENRTIEEVAIDYKESCKKAEPLNNHIKALKERLIDDSRAALEDPKRKKEFNGQTRNIVPGVSVCYSVVTKYLFEMPDEKERMRMVVDRMFETDLWRTIVIDPKRVVNPTAKEMGLLRMVGWKVIRSLVMRTVLNSSAATNSTMK